MKFKWSLSLESATGIHGSLELQDILTEAVFGCLLDPSWTANTSLRGLIPLYLGIVMQKGFFKFEGKSSCLGLEPLRDSCKDLLYTAIEN